MSFVRTKTVNGKKYQYEVASVREDGKVKQKVIRYLGPVNIESNEGVSTMRGFSATVQRNGQAWVTVSRSLAGKKIKGTYRVIN